MNYYLTWTIVVVHIMDHRGVGEDHHPTPTLIFTEQVWGKPKPFILTQIAFKKFLWNYINWLFNWLADDFRQVHWMTAEDIGLIFLHCLTLVQPKRHLMAYCIMYHQHASSFLLCVPFNLLIAKSVVLMVECDGFLCTRKIIIIVASLITKMLFEQFLICTAELKTADNEVGQIFLFLQAIGHFTCCSKNELPIATISISPLFSGELTKIKLMFAYLTQQDKII